MNSSGWLGYSVRELMQRAAKLILAASATTEPDLDKRLDLFHTIEVWDTKLHRHHPLEVRVRVTVRSRILEKR